MLQSLRTAAVARTLVLVSFELAGYLRRIRRTADLSQRQLAERTGISQSAVAAAEAGSRDLSVGRLAEAAAVADLRLALLDADGHEILPMTPDGARDAAHRRVPAHLDTQHSDEVADRWVHRPSRRRPWFTFALDRTARDMLREERGVPQDHDVPVPGDSPEDRAAARRRAAARARAEKAQQLAARRRAERAARGGNPWPESWTCTCPPGCEELDDRSGPPVHLPDCPCRCDVG